MSAFLLFFCVAIALAISNIDSLLQYYREIINYKLIIGIGPYHVSKTIVKFVNDGLMAIFFFFLGLEMKYHIQEGEFKDRRNLLLPALTAIGGFVAPALLYTTLNYDSAEGSAGWAIPVATDTAFVLAILTLMKHKVSDNIKVFVIGLSIMDDVLAVLTLAIFYTPELDIIPLLWSLIPLVILFMLNKFKSHNHFLYYVMGIILWLFVVQAGVHGTIAGITLACFIPTRIELPHKTVHLVKDMEASIHTLVAFVILPLFAFVNCELPFSELKLNDVFSTISIGCFIGLFFGKPFGIISVMYIAKFCNYVELPKGTTMAQFFGVASLCGIGFTLSLFIGLQAFDPAELENQMKIGVLLGSLCSIIVGSIIIGIGSKKHKADNQ
ncbi:Na+/H+ antiporter NhaA [Candidatus Bodocaedibacter vickermanii]